MYVCVVEAPIRAVAQATRVAVKTTAVAAQTHAVGTPIHAAETPTPCVARVAVEVEVRKSVKRREIQV